MTARERLSAMAMALALGQTPEGADWHPDPRSFEAALDAHRAEVLHEALALVSLHVALGAPPERILTELRRMADATTPTSSHSCSNCNGIDPESCLTKQPTEKES